MTPFAQAVAFLDEEAARVFGARSVPEVSSGINDTTAPSGSISSANRKMSARTTAPSKTGGP